ncbi:hypothetical protein [Roseisolibacter agri]|uniref:Uncharacterized protein n=1 Tax=Roseisolibacter agri TaxID=2014610 RepID=A0AA37Q324_9BACT|nr:hypothetical protein [Roseisolibacter agri]GLC25684.1 hypothetical protein rosag_21970 [Roseisolibacter agri]
MPVRLLLALVPVLVLITGGFALYQLWVAGVALRMQNWPFAAFYTVFGLAGLAVSNGLWRLRRGMRRPPEA